MIRRPPRSTLSSSSAASDVYKRQPVDDALSHARLAACDAVRINLEVALKLIGVSAPEVM